MKTTVREKQEVKQEEKKSDVYTAIVFQPKRGRSAADIQEEWDDLSDWLVEQGYQVLDEEPSEEEYNQGYFSILAFYVKQLSRCNAVLLAHHWQHSRLCNIMCHIAMTLGLLVLTASDIPSKK